MNGENGVTLGGPGSLALGAQYSTVSGVHGDQIVQIVTPEQENKLLRKQLMKLKDKTVKLNETLKAKKRANDLYMPKRSDKIDMALGNFLNKYPEKEKMKILFLRESEGVYRFGQRCVHIKIEKGNKILIKVGGGYMQARDFIEQYTESELQKVKRKDVGSRFATKLDAQKIAFDLSTSSVERRPINTGLREDSITLSQRSESRSKSRSITPVGMRACESLPVIRLDN